MLEKVDTEADLQTFVARATTGTEKPGQFYFSHIF